MEGVALSEIFGGVERGGEGARWDEGGVVLIFLRSGREGREGKGNEVRSCVLVD